MAKKAGVLISGIAGAGLLVAAAGAFFAVHGDDAEQPKTSAVPAALFEKQDLLKKACNAAIDTNLTGATTLDAASENCVKTGVPAVKQADNIVSVCAAFGSALIRYNPPQSPKASAVLLMDDPAVQLATGAQKACVESNSERPANITFFRIKP